jgi:hypothetical protein
MPIKEFMESLPYPFPSEAFDNGLANMPWFELMDELDEIACDPQWSGAKDIGILQDALYAQIGATALLDGIKHEAELEQSPQLIGRGRTRKRGDPST